jgi:MFS family permease
LRQAPAFRTLWLSRAVSFTGDGIARVALVLYASRSGPQAVGLVLLVNTLPWLIGPVAGAVADRVDQRRLLAWCEIGQGIIYGAIAIASPSLAVLLPLVAAAGLLATLFSPAGKSSVPRLVPADRLAQANALLGTAFNLQVVAGPAAGGVLVALTGTSAAFGVDAISFVASALLLARLPPLRPVEAGSPSGIWSETISGLRYAAHSPLPRALALGTLMVVSFAAVDNVALVFLVERDLHGSATAYGLTVAAFGVGMIIASLALSRIAHRWQPGRWLLLGTVASATGTAATGTATSLGLAAIGQGLAGTGNTAELVGTDTLVQQQVPVHISGRVFAIVYTAAQAGSGIASAAAGPLVAATGARTALFIAGGGTLLGLTALQPAIRPRPTQPTPEYRPMPPGPNS